MSQLENLNRAMGYVEEHLDGTLDLKILPPLRREQYAERLQDEVCGGAVWIELQHAAQDPFRVNTNFHTDILS